MKSLHNSLLSALLLCLLFSLLGCGRRTIASGWKDRPIVVDGQDTEWEGARMAFDKVNLGMGLMNDDKYLYLTMSLTDPTLQTQIMRQGLILWFDPAAKKGKSFGLRFPLGMQEMVRKRRTGERGSPPSGMDSDRMAPGRTPATAMLQALYERLTENPELEILGPAPDQRRRLLLAESQTILLQTSYENGRLVYELRLPLGSTADGIGAAPGEIFSLGFETPQLDLSALRQRGGPPGGTGGAGPAGGMGGPRGGGMDGFRGGFTRPEPLQLWLQVRLAAGPGQAGAVEVDEEVEIVEE